jgi:uncharacterized protein (TIGR02246 family)
MRKLTVPLVLAVAILGTIPFTISAQGKTDPALDKLTKAYMSAFNAKDAAKVAALYTEDAVLMPPNQAMVKGRANIQSFWAGALKEGAASLELRPMESSIGGTQAFEAGTYTLASKGAGGAAATEIGKYVIVLHRVGADWKIAYDIYNSDQPPPAK